MATYKRIDGDYAITTINSSDSILLESNQVDVSGNLTIGGSVTVANVIIGNLTAVNISGTLTTANQPYITRVGNLISLTVLGNLQSTNITGATITAGTISGTLVTATQNNITSLGTLSQLAVSGNTTLGNLTVSGTLNAGDITVSSIANGTSNVDIVGSGGNVTTSVDGNANVLVVTGTGVNVAGTLNATGVANIGGNANVSGNFVVGGFYFGDGGFLSNVSANIASATRISNGLSRVDIAVANGNITFDVATTVNVAVVSQSGLTVIGNISGSGTLDLAGNITTAGNVAGSYFLGNGSQLTGIDATSIQNGTSNVRVLSSGGNVSVGIGGTSNVAVWSTTGQNVAGALTVTGNITGGNIDTAGKITAVGNISGNYLLGNAFFVTGLSPTRIYNGTSEVNIGSSGGNANISVGGTANVLVAASTGVAVSGFVSNVNMNNNNITSLATPVADYDAATKLYVDNLVSTGIHYHQPVRVESPTNLNATYNQPGGPGVGVGATLTNAGANAALSIDGVSLNVNDRVLVYTQTNQIQNGVYTVTTVGNVSAAWQMTRSTDTDTYAPSTTTGLDEGSYFYVQEGATGAGESYVCNTVGTITFGTTNITFAQFSASQVYSAGTGLTLTGTQFSVNASQSQITTVGTLGSLSVTGNVTGGNLITTGLLSVTGNANVGNLGATNIVGTLTTAAQTNITSLGTLGSLSVTGNITGGNLSVSTGTITGGNIVNSNANGVGNIGSSATYFNTVFAKATSAQYADLAELYLADADYMPGTVVEFGGGQEITVCQTANSHRVAGVVSENPAHIMNAGLVGDHVVKLALVGRVRCLVHGPVNPGDILVSDVNGWARVNNDAAAGRIIGKSLESSDQDGYVEIVVGKH